MSTESFDFEKLGPIGEKELKLLFVRLSQHLTACSVEVSRLKKDIKNLHEDVNQCMSTRWEAKHRIDNLVNLNNLREYREEDNEEDTYTKHDVIRLLKDLMPPEGFEVIAHAYSVKKIQNKINQFLDE